MEDQHQWNYDLIDQSCFIQTFKIYSNTTFDDIKIAACNFWDFVEGENDKFVLTDEYFNNLSTYKDSI